MTIRKMEDTDLLNWPEHGITMTRAQSERLGEEGIDLPHGDPHVYAVTEPLPKDVAITHFSALKQRMEFHHRGRHEPPCMDCSE